MREPATEPSAPKSVLIVMPSLGSGGAERHCAWLATALDPARWTPHVLALSDGPLRPELERAGVSVRVADLPGGVRGLAAARDATGAALDEIRPAVVTGQQVKVEVALRAALRTRPGTPYLAWKHTYGHIGHRGLRERLFERATGSLVTRYGAVCHTQVRYLTEGLGLPSTRIDVLPNAVPLPPSAPAWADSPTVLMAAAMRADKDHALVLRAWPAVRRAVPGARLLLAGDGPCRGELEALATEGVEFLGLRNDVPDLLAQSQVLVLASYAVECFPYAALEAMAAGRAVVSTDVAGLPELVDDGVTGRLVPPRSAPALADALVEALGGRAREWGAAGRERVRTVYDFSRWAERAADLLDSVASCDLRPVDNARPVLSDRTSGTESDQGGAPPC